MTRLNYTPLFIIPLLVCMLSASASDRVTLLHGDIFIGDQLQFNNARYLHDRFGFRTSTPYWFVREIEENVNQLELTSTQTGNVTTDTLRVFGDRILSVTSDIPMETSNLELHPWRSDHWIAAERFIRGYIANRSSEGYNVLHASMVFYGTAPALPPNQTPRQVRLLEEKITVFKLYPHTMKPFLVDAWHVPWDQVESIRVVKTGESLMVRKHFSP